MSRKQAPSKTLAISEDLKKRILFTLMMLAIYRIGVAIPTPGVDGEAMLQFFNQQSSGLLGVFNTFTGGAFERFSVLALGIMPYISASIIFQLLQTAVPALEALKKEGDAGRRKLNQYTRYATVAIALLQGYGATKVLLAGADSARPLINTPMFGPIPFVVVTMLTLTAGTCFLMWLGEIMTEKGIGNGVSLIIFAGIVAGLPSGAINLWDQIQRGQLTSAIGLFLLIFMVVVIGAIVFMEVGQRRVPIQYSQRGGVRPGQAQQSSHLPLKVNFAGVIPPIFASSLLLFPATAAQFVNIPWMRNLSQSLGLTGALYNVLFVALVVFFCFFYTEVVFNPTEVADNLKKHGGFVPGIRAGRGTADYIKKVLNRLTVSGSVYLSVVCVLPIFLSSQFQIPFYFGGTGLLILVGVALDTVQQIQSYMISAKYGGSGLGGVRVKSRRVRY